MSTLFLIPTPLGDAPVEQWMLPGQAERLRPLTHFVVEAAKTARKHLKQLALATPLQQLQLTELNEHTPERELAALLAPLDAGHDMGLMSEAGCPAVADPGAGLVRLAHARGHVVEPLIGPSSLLLALMASGANGQRFAFHGYLPVGEGERVAALRKLEQESRERDCAQLFIETPYRNAAMLEALVAQCAPSTLICVATDLSLDTESVQTWNGAQWKKQLAAGKAPDFHKKPTVFLLLGQ